MLLRTGPFVERAPACASRAAAIGLRVLDALEISGSTPAARRAALASLSDAALADRLVALARSLRDAGDHAAIARAASLPLGEVLASPFALRAVALAVEAGARTVHLELRARVPWPDALGVPEEVRDPEHGVWDRGVLRSGKYQGFLADEAFAIYDPSHVSKWGPHELVHRAAGFFAREGASRFEHYLGARLNELVPVVLFYGPEQVMRLDEGPFDRAAAGRAPSASVDRARWLHDGEAALRERALASVPILREGLAHFERELRAIDEELATGRRVRAPHPSLDASSDATAYVVGHYDRLRAIEPVLSALPDEIACRDVRAYRERVEHLFDRLLFSPIALDLERAAARASGRRVWDVLHRAAHLGAEIAAELAPLASEARALVERAWEGEAAPVERFRARVAAKLDGDETRIVLADGFEPALDVLGEGLASVVPCTFALLDDGAPARFAASEAIWNRAPLAARVERWLEDPALREMARFEGAVASAARDDGIERLCVPVGEVPEDLDGLVVRSASFVRASFEHAVVETHAAFAAGEAIERPARAPGRWLIGGYGEGISVVPCPDAVSRAWDRLERGAVSARELAASIDAELGEVPEGWPEDGAAWVRELLEAGAIGWLGPDASSPRARRG